jgi:eukaryotic-like serine/threonine-protein kinase
VILQRGDRLGRYEVLEPIGTGGMGEVYRAHDTSLGKNIAIKIVSNGFADDPTAMPRFAMERRIGAGLEHPHICRLLDAGQEGAISYLAMEYLSGDTLAARLQRGPVPLQDALGFAIEIGEALSHAHDQGVIHCDLKPANIFITTSGIKVLDFGLAMLRRPRTATPITGDTVPLAPSRARVMGTAMYTAPERLAGDGADHRTDIFAFGAVLYELLARRPAFHPGVDGGVSAVLTSEPPPMNVPGPRASDLEWLVRRCWPSSPSAAGNRCTTSSPC